MSANRSTGSDIKSEKFAGQVAAALAAAIMEKGGARAVEAAGVAAAHAIASESSGKGATKNAKREMEERAAWEISRTKWHTALAVWNEYATKAQTFLDAGYFLPFVIPPPHPGPHPGPFVS